VRRSLLVLLLVPSIAACTRGKDAAAPGSSVTESSPPAAASVPDGVPPAYDDDAAAGDIPAAALIPVGADVTGSWHAATSAGEAIVVAWSLPGPDPFRLDRGIVAWRRFDDGGAPWRPVWGHAYPGRRSPLQSLTARIADVTADGSADAVVLAETGGSGACGTTSVIDLAVAARVYRSRGCDRIVEPAADPVGLSVREAVYAPGDAHCCPSSVRTSVLVYVDGSWRTVVSTTSPA
jgi:hypothetical protein